MDGKIIALTPRPDVNPEPGSSGTVRRFSLAKNVVSLARIDGHPGPIIRPRFEIHILKVVGGQHPPLDRS